MYVANPLLVWVAGVASTVAGAWLTSGIRIYQDGRQAHLADIRQRILGPLRANFVEQFDPLLTRQEPLVVIDRKFAGRPDSPSVLEPAMRTKEALVGVAPRKEVFVGIPPGLLADVNLNHQQALFSKLESFLDSWTALTVKAKTWTSQLSKEILAASALLASPNTLNEGCVMHFAAGIYIYRRLCDLPTYELQYERHVQPPELRVGGSETLARGDIDQLGKIREKMDELVQSKDRQSEGRKLNAEIDAMHRQYQRLLDELDMAIASQQLHGRCDLVSFPRIF